jgi:hypothetical protein
MSQDVSLWISYASVASPAIPLVCLLLYWKRQPRQHKILAISLCISIIFDVICLVLMHKKISNIFYINLYTIIAFPVIMVFYHETLIKRSLKILVRIFTVVFLASALIFALHQGLVVVNSNTWTLSSILITITSFFFVGDLNLMDESSFLNSRFHETNVILNTSLALYYFSTIIMFAMTEYIFSHFTQDDIRFFWMFHNAAHVFKNVGITLAFYLSAKRISALANSSKTKASHYGN